MSRGAVASSARSWLSWASPLWMPSRARRLALPPTARRPRALPKEGPQGRQMPGSPLPKERTPAATRRARLAAHPPLRCGWTCSRTLGVCRLCRAWAGRGGRRGGSAATFVQFETGAGSMCLHTHPPCCAPVAPLHRRGPKAPTVRTSHQVRPRRPEGRLVSRCSALHPVTAAALAVAVLRFIHSLSRGPLGPVPGIRRAARPGGPSAPHTGCPVGQNWPVCGWFSVCEANPGLTRALVADTTANKPRWRYFSTG